jgi:DNA modification methylase
VKQPTTLIQANQYNPELITDPLKFKELCWPDIKLYDKQVDIIYSVVENDETYVPVGNKLGKDFISAFIVIWFFCSRSPCRIVTTSATNTQLEAVLNFAREWKSNNRRKRKESFKQWQSKQERELHEWRKSLLNGRLEGWKSTSNRLKGIDERGIT